MDVLLSKVTAQAMNYAIRSGLTLTTTYALKQCGRLLKETPRSPVREELQQLQLRLESKIRILSPAIDMIDLISARGNTTLESAVSLTKEIRFEMQRLGGRMNSAADERRQQSSSRAKDAEAELRSIILQIKGLLHRIDDAVPLINLAITTSGVNLSTKLSGSISPSRLLQASTFLTAADSQFLGQHRVQVGPTWTLSLYMLFAGHSWREEMTWKEVLHKARVKLVRVALDELYALPGEQHYPPTANGDGEGGGGGAEYAYQLLLVEDLDDDRVHTFDDDSPQQPGSFEDVRSAGVRDLIPIHEISKIFYADTGKILGLGGGGGEGETNHPVLLLRRDVHAEPPGRMMRREEMANPEMYDESVVLDEHSELEAQFDRESAPPTPSKHAEAEEDSSAWRLPADLDPEWMAFEVYSEEPDSDTEELDEPQTSSSRPASSSRADSLGPSDITTNLSKLNLKAPSPAPNNQLIPKLTPTPTPAPGPAIKTSLSLLEMLLKLTALQQFRQAPHLSIEDELLNFFLEDSATAGAGTDQGYRQRLRQDVTRRVGFDPYDESPVKRRGEEYIEHAHANGRPEVRAGEIAAEARHSLARSHDDDDDDDDDGEETFQGALEMGDGGYAYNASSPLGVRQTTERASPLPPSSPSPGSKQTPPSRYPYIHTHSPDGRSNSQASLLATPPSSTKSSSLSRQAFLRAQSEPQGRRSPLGREVASPKTESGDDGE